MQATLIVSWFGLLGRTVRFLLVENLLLSAALALGLVGVWLLLPRPRRISPWPGVAAAGLALVLAGLGIVRVGVFSVEGFLFYAFSALAVLGGGLLVTQHNPVRAALAFALVVLSTCGLFLLQAAPFLAAATTIVYAGAIIVTFLFVIMLAQQAGLSDADARSREPLLACLAGFGLLGALLFVLQRSYDTQPLSALLVRAERALATTAGDELLAQLGDPVEFVEGFRRQRDQFAGQPDLYRQLDSALLEVETSLRRDDAAAPDSVRAALTKLTQVGQLARSRQGDLHPPASLPLSAFSGPPANQPAQIGPLPAQNVAALGRALFTDFLLAVELGGTLLLVATVGAIAIASRQAERPR